MKKKLLYGLMGLLFALSLVGFVACDDDDDDDGGGGGGTATAVYYGSEEQSDLSSVTVTYDSNYAVKEIVVKVDVSNSGTISSPESSDDEDYGTVYYGTVTIDDAIYKVKVAYVSGGWYYDYEKYDILTASYNGTSDLESVQVAVDEDGDIVYVYVEGDDVTDTYASGTYTYTVKTTTTATVYTITVTAGDTTTASYTYKSETAYIASGTLSEEVLVYYENNAISKVTVGSTSATDNGDGTYTTADYYTLTISVSNGAASYTYVIDYEAAGYTKITLTTFELSSSLTELLSTTKLTGASEVLILITVSITSSTSSEPWFNLGTSSSDWTTLKNETSFRSNAAEDETYVIKLTSSGYSIAGEDANVTYGYSGTTGSSPTLSTFSETGIYFGGLNITLDAVYVKYSE